MAFTSFTYLYFLAIVVALYWIIRNRIAQNVLLVIASYVFYGWLTPWYCVLLATSTVITYGCLLLLWRTPEGQPRSRAIVAVSIVANIGMLAVLKYWNFWIEDIVQAAGALGWKTSETTLSIALPLGLSFYTLQAVGITVDAYRGEVTKQSFLNIALFLSFFPKLIAGPFEKAATMLASVNTLRIWQWRRVDDAISLFIFGFLKKVLVAENIRLYVDQIFFLQEPNLPLLLCGGFMFGIQILADFSGYTDIARGSGKLLGFDLTENFNNPYLAISPSDFWRRWHISLSRWFRDYVYIPLGGSHGSRWTLFTAVMATMTLSGTWHGANLNFLLWGAMYGILISLYTLCGYGGAWKPATRTGHVIAWIIMSVCTLTGWVLFRANSIDWIWKAMSTPTTLDAVHLLPPLALMLIACAYSTPWLLCTLMKKKGANSFWNHLADTIGFLSLFILGANNIGDFVYFRF